MNFKELSQRLPEWKSALGASGFLKLSSVEALTDDELVEFSESLSEVKSGPKLLEWDFGKIMRMKYDSSAANYLFSSEKVPLHWDGPFHVEPRYLIFFCDTSAGSDGATVFVDTEAILKDLPPETIETYRKITLTYTTEKKAHYGGQFSTKVVAEHPFHNRPVLRFAEVVETDLNPVELTVDGSENPHFYQELEELVTSPKYRYEHNWVAGDLLVVDNHSYLHGRNALGDNLGRSFRRIQVL